ncbi:hypothetical protein MseVgp170 [Melanoplus sanguinipes entomopoxvirus]|uniref:Uncharacterized protein n=1 Tax=Melanoplus sanguinipes entomopoxvirus TaxID=83191 RepID=Q9YVS2_MSEPV|nr:hypothetical protein MseVgp170 [Melanoplus sanguinipes entomopoxvirus]AAC97685.1 ORF MSV170 hypothetical protein [Melanoplus sanguinipes entomopoxvirus 'O']
MEDIDKILHITVINDDEINTENDTEVENIKNTDFDGLKIFTECGYIFKNVTNKKIQCIICNESCNIHCIWCSDENCVLHSINKLSLVQFNNEHKMRNFVRINTIFPKNVTFYLTGKFNIVKHKKKDSFSDYYSYIEIYTYTMIPDMLKIIENKIFETEKLIVDKKIPYSYNDYLKVLRVDKLNDYSFVRSAENTYPIVYIDTNKDYNKISIKYNDKKYEFKLKALCNIYPDLDNSIKSYFKESLLTICINPVCFLIPKIDPKFTLKFKFNVLINMKEQSININRPDIDFNNQSLTKEIIEEFIDNLTAQEKILNDEEKKKKTTF